MIKVEIKKDMMLEGKNKDLSKFLDDYIERFNSGKLSSKDGWIEPTYIGRHLEKSTYDGIFKIKSVYKEDDKYYFETDSDEVKNLVENEFFKAGKRVFYDDKTEDLFIESIDLVGTDESYRYNKYKRLYSLSMNWFSDKVTLDIFEIYREFHIEPIRYYEIKFGDRLIYRGTKLEYILHRTNVDFLNFLYVPVQILKYKFDNDPKGYLIEDESVYKFPTTKFIDYVTDKSLKNNIIFDTKDKYNINNEEGVDIAILVYDEFGTNDRYFIKYNVSDGKVLSVTPYWMEIFFHTDVKLPMKQYFEISSELERLENAEFKAPSRLYYLSNATDSQIESGNRIHDILASNISPWSAHAVSDTLKIINTKYKFLELYDKYNTYVDLITNKEYNGAILADVYKPDALVDITIDETTNKYNGKEFIRLFATTEGKLYYKLDNYNKFGINVVKLKENDSIKVFVTDKYGTDISGHFLSVRNSYKDDVVLFLDLDNNVSDFYIMIGIFEKLNKHRDFINEALDDFKQFKREYERRMEFLEMSEDELIEYFNMNDMVADEFRKVYPYITKIKFY